jgi:hypothetical protein
MLVPNLASYGETSKARGTSREPLFVLRDLDHQNQFRDLAVKREAEEDWAR